MSKQTLVDTVGSTGKADIQACGKCAVLLLGLALPSLAAAELPCDRGMRIDGVISDPTGARIVGAHVRAARGAATVTDATGHYVLPCVPAESTTITADAAGFARVTAWVHRQRSETIHVNLRLPVAPVETNVAVDENASGVDSANSASSTVLGPAELARLSDDPDDLLRQLQYMAASGGGPPESAVITLNGFQRGTSLPSRDSIASIRINPDPFSSEHETAPWMGGRIEVTTKPGARTYHGALFFVDSDSTFNATDPLSTTATPATNQRFGFELSGPIRGKNTDFFFALEKRNIHEFNVIDAVTLDRGFNPAPFEQAVGAPQNLWIGSARGDWQITPKDSATLSFSANVNSLGNQGIGGLALADSGFNSQTMTYDVRLSDTQTVSARLVHETRISYTWSRAAQTPLSTQPSLQVAGYFLGGGSTAGDLNNRERNLETDDDAILARGKNSVKFGLQSFGIFVHDKDPDTFNGAYTFGGGSAPELDSNNNPTGETTTITALEQYRRALLNLPGGTPTIFQICAGTPLLPETQWRLALYVQDSTKLGHRLTVNAGLRYQLQTTPSTFVNFAPRAGLAWAPDKKSNWMIHLNAGLFSSPVSPAYTMQADRLNGVRQQETTIYSPNFQNPMTAAPISVSTLWQLPNTFSQLPSLMAQAGAEHDFPHKWHAAIDFDYGADWNHIREENINAPMVASSVGIAPDPIAALLAPRPIAVNENIFRYEQLSHQRGAVFIFALRQYSYKRFGFSANYLHMNMRSDGGFRTSDTTSAANPQSAYSEQGEFSRVDWETPNILFATGYVNLPLKLGLSPLLNMRNGRPYNITTGTDANGDSDFNDRPSFASAPGPGVYSTPVGLLTTNTVNGNVPRNLGTMPAQIHLDMNLNRAFTLKSGDKEHPRVFTFNARSINVLNHTNVIAVNTILSSGAVGLPITAETARRVELGARFTF
jgi:Carboxypeptidase regulatory-like domain